MPPRSRIFAYIVAALLAATILFVQTPYSLILPGSAVDVRDVVSVAGHQPPSQSYYLTDVNLEEDVSPILLVQVFFPGTRVVHTNEVVPQGVSIPQFESIMKRAMDESQAIAAVVACLIPALPVMRTDPVRALRAE